MSSIRCRLNDNKVEKQVSIAHNSTQLYRRLCNKRESLMHFAISDIEREREQSPSSDGVESDRVQMEINYQDADGIYDWDAFDARLSSDVLQLEQSV